jgi:hypothetical protein
MRRKMLYTIAVAIFFLSLNHSPAYAQADETRKIELGGQFTLLNLSTDIAGFGSVQCIIPPCPVITSFTEKRETEFGFGGRIGYNVHRNVTLEAELNFLPEDEFLRGGNKVQGLFGVKAGKRFDKVGVFAKVRPGFFHQTEGEFGLRPDVVCAAVFPPPEGCVNTSGVTNFNVDVGGVVEAYPSPRTIVRFDVGDTIIRTGDRDFGTGIGLRSRTEHNLQGGIGIGFRF